MRARASSLPHLIGAVVLGAAVIGCAEDPHGALVSGSRPDATLDAGGAGDLGIADTSTAAPDAQVSLPADAGADAGAAPLDAAVAPPDTGPAPADSGTGLAPLPFEPAGPNAVPDPMAPGPFPVGVRTVDLFDPQRVDRATNSPRFLRAEIWYPAVPAAAAGPFHSYDMHVEGDDPLIDLGEKRDDFMAADIGVIESRGVRDAPIERRRAPYPIVLFSHGMYMLRFQYVYFTQHLASHGYIVVAVDHEGNTAWDVIRDGFSFTGAMGSVRDRVRDMPFVLDEMLGKNGDPASFLYGAIDGSKAAFTGHSFGGLTAMSAACREPSQADAVVALSPHTTLAKHVYCELSQYPVPLMVMGATEDQTVSWRIPYCDYRLVDGVDKYMYELAGLGHFTFSDMCSLRLENFPRDPGAPDIRSDGCDPTQGVPWQDAHRTVDYYATALLNLHLRDSAGSAAHLVEHANPPFDPVTFYIGDTVPNWPDGGCRGQ